MWGGNQPAFVPDSLDDDDGFQVVYGDERHEGAGGPESQQAARAGRPRYALPQASSAVKPAARSLAAAEAAAAAQQQHPASPTLSGGPPPREAPPSPGAPAADAPQQPPLTLAQELQTVLSGLSPQHQAPAAGWGGPVPQVQAAAEGEPGGWRARQRTGPRQNALHNSPAAPAAAAAAGGAAGTAGGSRFFAVDADLLQAHAQRQAVAAAPPGQGRQQRRQPPPQQQQAQRTVQWDSPQAQLPAEHTPLPSQRPNPLAALLGGGSVPHPRQATTGSRMRGRHPIYGAAAATAAGGATAAVASVETGGAAAGAAAASTGDVGSSGSRLREMGFRDAPLNSPRQLQQQQQQQPRRPLPQQQQHTRFAIRDVQAVPASSAAAAADVAASQQHQQPPAAAAAVAVPGAAAGLRLLTGSEPASALRQQQFQPRPPRPPSPGEGIEEEPQQEQRWQQQQQDQQQAWQQQQQQQQQAWGQQRQGWGQPQDAAAEAAGDGFRTPGQPLRRSRQEEEWQQPQQQQQQQQGGTGGSHLGAPGAAAAGTGGRGIGSGERGAPGSTGGKQMSLQRQFVAQLQPVSRPAAAATMQQQRQRLAGAAGLHARMQAILAAEKAGLQAGGQSPTGGQPGAGPRLTVLQKELEGSITKLHCRCDTPAAAAFGAAEVAAFLQSRTAREVDTTPGSVILLREPWRIVPLAGSPLPVVLCFAASEG